MHNKILFFSKSLRYWMDSVSYRKKYRHGNNAIDVLKNKYKGSPMLVIGNGPSLNKTPLEDFIDIPSIGMNKINLLFERTAWRPKYIVCTNNLVIRQNRSFFVDSTIPVFLSWKGRWFFKRANRNVVEYFLSLNLTKFSKDISMGVGSSGTVTYTALQFCYYMGANPVILFGVDHSFQCQGKPNEIVKMEGDDPNHFDPNYFAEGQKWGLPNFDRIKIAYRNAKNAFEKDKRLIYDATIGGKLDIFPKIGVEKARGICSL